MAHRGLSLLGFLPLGRDLILTHSQLIIGFTEQRMDWCGVGGGVRGSYLYGQCSVLSETWVSSLMKEKI